LAGIWSQASLICAYRAGLFPWPPHTPEIEELVETNFGPLVRAGEIPNVGPGDPWAALLGARRGVPVAYVDSLFWFWKWDEVDFTAIPAQAGWWVSADIEKLREMTSQPLNWHVIVPMVYHWSGRVFAQRTPDAARRAKLFPDGRVDLVGAVIASHSSVMKGSAAPLVSVSGAISHVTPLEVALRYARVVREILLRTGEFMSAATITGNAAVLPVFQDGPWRVREMSLSAMHAAMSQALFLVAPCRTHYVPRSRCLWHTCHHPA